MAMIAAIEYAHPDPVKDSGGAPGLDEAAIPFLAAWFRYSLQNRFICRSDDVMSYEHLENIAKASGIDDEEKCVRLDPCTRQYNLETISCLFRPGPSLSNMIWRRQELLGRGYAACGYAPHLNGSAMIAAVADLFIAPSTNSDALICSSEAERNGVHKIWNIYTNYMNQRFGGSFCCPMQTPVIPPGIEAVKYFVMSSSDKKIVQRQALGATDSEIIILSVSSPEHAVKSHPLPLLLAAEHAAQNVNKKVRHILHRYFKPHDPIERRYYSIVKDICQKLRCDLIAADDPRFPIGLWAAADIYAALADNVRDSNDQMLLKAMACGLPAVVANWNGYRDTVRDNMDGILIPTLSPPDDAGLTNAGKYYNDGDYEKYLLGAAQSTIVDIRAASVAFILLANDDDKRRSMGESGRARIRNMHDWSVIIPAYEKLWQQLSEQRSADKQMPVLPDRWPALSPAYPSPWAVYEGYASKTLLPYDALRVVMTPEEIAIILRNDLDLFVTELLVPPSSLQKMIEAIRRTGTVRILDMIQGVTPSEQPRLWRCFAWMLKHGICVREKL